MERNEGNTEEMVDMGDELEKLNVKYEQEHKGEIKITPIPEKSNKGGR